MSSSSHRPLTTQHTTTYKTNIHALNGVCIRDPRNETATDLHFRSCGQQVRSSKIVFVTASVLTHWCYEVQLCRNNCKLIYTQRKKFGLTGQKSSINGFEIKWVTCIFDNLMRFNYLYILLWSEIWIMKLHWTPEKYIAHWQLVVRQKSWVLSEVVVMLVTFDGEGTARGTSGRRKRV